MTPEKIKLHKHDGNLELTYADGNQVTFSAEFLRIHSPSAEVRGHGPGEEVLQHSKKNVKIVSLQATGHYALLIEFDDGHNTGIYSWSYLQELHDNRDQLWESYLRKLNLAGQTRDPEETIVKFINPS
ncbi:MAG: DUF971 domain-containing protein [Porticoccaceae bacterium]|nr:DUF971 domain-containing protein [Porticoccaceae bacterium]